MRRGGVRLITTVSTAPTTITQPSTTTGVHLFPDERIVETPSWELTRFLSSHISQTAYTLFLEKSFNKQSLLIGANDGLSLACNHIHNRNWERLSAMAASSLVDSLHLVRDVLPSEVESSLLFNQSDVVHSFIYRSFLSGRQIFKVSETSNLFIYYIIVSYIRRTNKVPYGLSASQYLRKHRNDLTIANIGYGRAVNPLGAWKITNLNIST